ncbi:MAG: MBL fold metallo-hydrolase [Dehalococcoidales bacterium]|nr:MBL fold metallo-hydrolase [Dehalococcoidales bacterium]
MTEIIPGIYQMPIPIPNNPLGYTNTYLIRGNGECLLIDTGWNNEETLQSLQDQLAEIGVGFKDISRIIATHAHPDHYGLAGRLRELSSASIALHSLEEKLITSRYLNADETLRQTGEWLRVNGMPSSELPATQTGPAGARRFGAATLPDIILHGGEDIAIGGFNLKVLWTPGHSPGHICLYEPAEKILFSGDHVLPVITPHVSLQNQSGNNPLVNFLNSLNEVKQLDVKVVLPAHEHLFADLPKRVAEIFQHHEHRNSEILEAIKTGPKTAYQISAAITWMPSLDGVRFQNLAPWDKRMAVSETLAHLEAMRTDSRVDKIPRDSIIYYHLN